jgi:hypothetical protein
MSSPETMLESEVAVRFNATYSRIVGLIAECPENRALRYDCEWNGLVNSTWKPIRNDKAKGSTVTAMSEWYCLKQGRVLEEQDVSE